MHGYMENKFPASSQRIYFGNIISVNETISSISKNYKWTEEMFLDCFLWTYPVNIENKSLKRGAAAKIASFGKDDLFIIKQMAWIQNSKTYT